MNFYDNALRDWRWLRIPALLLRHVASELYSCRARFPDARCFWERDLELDLIAPDPQDPKRLLVAEVKWPRLSTAERNQAMRQLHTKWSRCSLQPRHSRVRFEVFDATSLPQIPQIEQIEIR